MGSKSIRIISFLCLALGALTAIAVCRPPERAGFVFHRTGGGQWRGACTVNTDVFQTAVFTLDSASSITSGKWRGDMNPSAVWSGIETDSGWIDTTVSVGGVLASKRMKVAGGYADSTIEIELYPGGVGVLRSQDGWYAISEYYRSGREMNFSVDTSAEVAPNALDGDIIRRAANILSSETVWNRADNRNCDPKSTAWSIYCAMERATREVTGGFHHRRPALQLIRKIVEERTAGRNYRHRLMDYNNDPATTFEEVTSLFTEALSRIRR